MGAGAWQNYLDIIRTAFDALIHYAAPLMIVLILAEMMLAIMSVHSPRLQPYYLAMPIKTMLGLLVLILYQPHLWHVLGEWFRHWYGGGWLVL